LRPQSGRLLDGEHEHEVGWEFGEIALDRLVEALGLHAVELGQISVDDHALAANRGNTRRDGSAGQ
jgi:hypothetical protein